MNAVTTDVDSISTPASDDRQAELFGVIPAHTLCGPTTAATRSTCALTYLCSRPSHQRNLRWASP
eukprot:3538350-Pleurochrysis_carterae.AAC.1